MGAGLQPRPQERLPLVPGQLDFRAMIRHAASERGSRGEGCRRKAHRIVRAECIAVKQGMLPIAQRPHRRVERDMGQRRHVSESRTGPPAKG